MTFFVFFMAGICIYFVHSVGEGKEWFSSRDNSKKLRKCFGQEGMLVFENHTSQKITISLTYEGENHSLEMPFSKAVRFYKQNPTGQGLRKKIIKHFKLDS